jgi:hypothetical protein
VLVEFWCQPLGNSIAIDAHYIGDPDLLPRTIAKVRRDVTGGHLQPLDIALHAERVHAGADFLQL